MLKLSTLMRLRMELFTKWLATETEAQELPILGAEHCFNAGWDAAIREASARLTEQGYGGNGEVYTVESLLLDNTQ